MILSCLLVEIYNLPSFFRWAQWSGTCETWRVTCPASSRTRTHNSTESTSRQPQTSPESRWPTTRRQHSWNNMCDVIQRPVHFKVLSSFNNLKVDFCKKLKKIMNYSLLWFALCSENFEFLDNMLFQIFKLILMLFYVSIYASSNVKIIRVLNNKTEECRQKKHQPHRSNTVGIWILTIVITELFSKTEIVHYSSHDLSTGIQSGIQIIGTKYK